MKSSVLKQMEDLKEETGLTCCICREGYRYQPAKVLFPVFHAFDYNYLSSKGLISINFRLEASVTTVDTNIGVSAFVPVTKMLPISSLPTET